MSTDSNPLRRPATKLAPCVFADHSRLSQARKLFKEADDRAGAARLDALFADGRQTQAGLEQAFQLQPGAGGAAAAMLAISGEDEVLRALERIQKDRSQDTLLSLLVIPTAKAAQAVRAGNGTRAIEWLNGTRRFEPGAASLPAIYTRGLAYFQTNSGREAATEFQKILDHRRIDPLSPLYPLSYLGLARAHTLAADLPNARKSYQDFLAIWKDADPDIPILVQARREYANLGSG